MSANLSNLAVVVRERGDFDEPERLLEQAMAIDRKLYGADHVSIAFYLNEMAVVLRLEGRPDSAALFLRRVLAMNLRLQGPDGHRLLLRRTLRAPRNVRRHRRADQRFET